MSADNSGALLSRLPRQVVLSEQLASAERECSIDDVDRGQKDRLEEPG